MTEVEAPAPVTAPETTPAALPFDESLLVRVKGRVIEPTKPDDTERNMLVSKLQAEIQKNSDRIRDIKQLVEEMRGNAKSATQGTQDVVKRMQGFKNEFQSVLRQKQHIRSELQAVTAEINEARNLKRELQNELRSEVRVFTVEAVDSRIRDLEAKLNHESHDINDENSLRALVKKLTSARSRVAELEAATAKLVENEQVRTEIMDRLKQCDEVLNGIKEKENKEKGTLDEMRSRGDGHTGDVPTLNVEKQECYDIIVACRDKIQSVREEYNKKYEEYIKMDRNFRAWRNWDRKQKYEQRQKDREERSKQREEQQREERGVDLSALNPDPYESEIFLCDQAAVFLKKFMASEDTADKAEAKAVEAPAPGMVLFRRKKDEDLESMFTGLGKKKGKKAEKPVEKKVADKKFSHDLDTLKTFMSIGVPAPNSTSDVPKTLEAVMAKKEEFIVKQKTAKENRANGVHSNGKDKAGTSADAEENGEEVEESEEAANGAEPAEEEESTAEAAEPAVEEETSAVPQPEAEAEAAAPEVEAEAPVAEPVAEAPKAEVAAEAPEAEVVAEAPKAEAVAEALKAEVVAEVPKAEPVAAAPEVVVEAPKAEVAVEAPKAEANGSAVEAAPAKSEAEPETPADS